MFFCLYNLVIWVLTIFFIPPWFLVLKIKGKKVLPYLTGFSREEISQIKGKKILWIQASSVGETMVAARLLQELTRVFPDYAIVFTCMTSTGYATAQRILTGKVELIGFIPLDHPWLVKRFFNRVHPQILILIETELWPNILREANRRKVKTAVINGRLSDRSLSRMKKIKIAKPLFQLVDVFCVQTELDKEKFITLGAPPPQVQVTGNAKFDQEYPEVPTVRKRDLTACLSITEETPVLTAASTHGGEEELIIKAFLQIKKSLPTAFLILAPRHLERSGEIEKIFAVSGLRWLRRTAMPNDIKKGAGEKVDILLLDTFGELNLAYSLSTVTFVGGSLVPVGGHNILEAAAQKKVVLYGPYMHNFLESQALLEKTGAGITVANWEQLAEQFLLFWGDQKLRVLLGEKAWEALLANRGAAEKTVLILKDQIQTKN